MILQHECSADMTDPAYVARILAAHRRGTTTGRSPMTANPISSPAACSGLPADSATMVRSPPTCCPPPARVRLRPTAHWA